MAAAPFRSLPCFFMPASTRSPRHCPELRGNQSAAESEADMARELDAESGGDAVAEQPQSGGLRAIAKPGRERQKPHALAPRREQQARRVEHECRNQIEHR